ncbi:MAG: hypothetical protein K2L52_04330 [Clostridia bacterium]|nr:hypothetical protein [Clostridia bacterium]
MKKIVWIIIAVLLLTFPISLMAGCSNNDEMLLQCNDENFGNYKGKTVEGMSAYDLIMEAYENSHAEQNYTREEYFCFNSSVATRNSHLIRKIVDDKVYNQEIIVGTGFDKGTSANRFYYDGKTANFINNTNTKRNNITYNKSTKKFNVKDWGSFVPFNGDLEKDLKMLRYKITTYDIYSRDILSPKHNDKVYEKDGVYYCQIKINCSTEKLNSVQLEAFEEFLDMLSAKSEGFTMEDTTIDFAISQIDGEYKILIWKRTEIYSGKHASTGLRVSCRQECLSYYTYGNAVITSDDLLNLA